MKELKKLLLVSGCVLLFVVFYILCSCSAKDARNSYTGSTDSRSSSGVQSDASELLRT